MVATDRGTSSRQIGKDAVKGDLRFGQYDAPTDNGIANHAVTAGTDQESFRTHGTLQHFATIPLERRKKYEVTFTCVK